MTSEKILNINSFANDLRDYADRDYIATRVLAKNECMEQFGYYMQQTLEKYFKSILLFHQVPNCKPLHSLEKLLNLCKSNIKYFDLSVRSQTFLKLIDSFELIRYPDFPFTVQKSWLIDFDYTVKELRFFATNKDDNLLENYKNIKNQRHKKLCNDYIYVPKFKRHFSGYLEKVLFAKTKNKSIERSQLIWKNYFFSSRKQSIFKFSDRRISRNNHMYVSSSRAKEMYNDLKDLIHFPKGLIKELEKLD
jgi:hypothetical protein